MSDQVKIEVSDDEAKIMALALIANASVARENLQARGPEMTQEFFDMGMASVLHAYEIANRIGAAAGFDCDELVETANAVRDRLFAEHMRPAGGVH